MFSVCLLELITGPCKGSYPVFGFESDTGKCVEFTYGGCAGNGNRFTTQEKCQKVCEKGEHIKFLRTLCNII